MFIVMRLNFGSGCTVLLWASVMDNIHSEWSFLLKMCWDTGRDTCCLPSLHSLFLFLSFSALGTRYGGDIMEMTDRILFLPWGMHRLADIGRWGWRELNKPGGSAAEPTGVNQASPLPHLLAVGTWVNYWISLSPNFLICKIAIMILILQGFCEN